MLFHVGALWRMNELGLLPKLDSVFSVSGGSILAGVLALRWKELKFDDTGRAHGFESEVVTRVRKLAATTVDVPAIVWGLLKPWSSIADEIATTYREELFGDSTLKDLPDKPQFFFIATNLQTGSPWIFSKKQMGESKLGWVRRPNASVATAVTASAAFPPFLSPVQLNLRNSDFDGGSEFQIHERLDTAAFREHVLLTDGGVYDNLGLGGAQSYKTVLVSNAGGRLQPNEQPGGDWVRQVLSVIDILYDQPATERSSALRDDFAKGVRDGAYWSSLNCGVLPLPAPQGILPMDCELVNGLARIPTRLRSIDPRIQEQLINAGYALSDIMLRSYVESDAPPPTYPYKGGLGDVPPLPRPRTAP